MKNFDLESSKKINSGFKIPENYFEEFEEQLMQRISFEETTQKTSTGFKTPEFYFETLEDRLLQRINFEENNEKTTTGFVTPNDYFETFEERLLQRINFEENNKKIATGFTIPENYFENIEDNIISQINSKEKSIKVVSFLQRKSVWISGIAATLIISLGTFFYFNQVETQNNISTKEYLAYSSDLSTYEIANELTDAEITKLENELVLLDKNETEKYVNEYLN
ncbi:MAG: hypothetical protein QM535_13145 [Limnohabitans sp.]|nr:hypothetical protein [Limnohabitans sp.]